MGVLPVTQKPESWVFPGKRKPGPTQPLALNIYGRHVQGHPKLEVTQTPLVVPVVFPKSGMAISGKGGKLLLCSTQRQA